MMYKNYLKCTFGSASDSDTINFFSIHYLKVCLTFERLEYNMVNNASYQ